MNLFFNFSLCQKYSKIYLLSIELIAYSLYFFAIYKEELWASSSIRSSSMSAEIDRMAFDGR